MVPAPSARNTLLFTAAAAPEQSLDFSGYTFWPGKPEQFNGNYANAEMVKALITSVEYRRRFGQ